MTRLAPHPSVVCTVIDEGGVLLHLDTKYYYSLNASGYRIWTLLEDGHGSQAEILAAEGAGRAANEIDAFLAALESESLVERMESGGNGAAASNGAHPVSGNGGAAPTLRKHDVPLNQILSNPFDPSVPLAE